MRIETSTRLAPVDTDSDPASHPPDGEIAAYIEGVLPADDRVGFEAHFADCEYCRSRLILARELVATAPRLRRRNLLFPASLIAAAATIAGLLLLPGRAADPLDRAEFRAGALNEVQRIQLLQPPRGGTLRKESPLLIWAAIEKDALYQITLSTAAGSVLWTERMADTVATVPAATVSRLRPGERYFWRVDALLPNLRSVTTGDQPFLVTSQ
jgi:anti-sigma factor RsiW